MFFYAKFRLWNSYMLFHMAVRVQAIGLEQGPAARRLPQPAFVWPPTEDSFSIRKGLQKIIKKNMQQRQYVALKYLLSKPWQKKVCWLLLCSILLYKYNIVYGFISLPSYFGCFQFLAVTRSAAINIPVLEPWSPCTYISVGTRRGGIVVVSGMKAVTISRCLLPNSIQTHTPSSGWGFLLLPVLVTTWYYLSFFILIVLVYGLYHLVILVWIHLVTHDIWIFSFLIEYLHIHSVT